MMRLHARAMREDRGRFAALQGERVFIYWPHGLGDWVHLSTIFPLLEPSNRYAIARFGDDYSSVLEGNEHVAVLPSGVRALDDGSALGAKHLGLDLRRLDGRQHQLTVPEPLGSALEAFDPTVVLWTDYPETEGRAPFPFHTKARHLARLLIRNERLSEFDLARPLAAGLETSVEPKVQATIDERLRAFASPGSRVYVLSRTGYTAPRKNWADAQARTFVHLLRMDDPAARVVAMDDPSFGDSTHWAGREIVAGYRELFAGVDAPFARAYLALLARTDGVIAVPAGPLHVAMARGGVPIVGLWLAHLPEWYDEPNPGATHLIGSYVRERGFEKRPGSTTLPPTWRHRTQWQPSREISAEAVLYALRSVR